MQCVVEKRKKGTSSPFVNPINDKTEIQVFLVGLVLWKEVYCEFKSSGRGVRYTLRKSLKVDLTFEDFFSFFSGKEKVTNQSLRIVLA